MRKTKDLNKNKMCVGAGPVSAQKGITLIALVITIIVMLILVAVTISMAVNGGLFEYAGRAVGDTNNAIKAEGQLADGGIEVGGVWYNSIDEYLATKNLGTGTEEPVETISKETSYVGCYADVDGDGDADGVIYADLAFSKEANYWYGYSYEAVAAEELKDYYVSGTYDGAFNEEGTPKEVITATGEGKDRFYVMALEDIDGQQNGTYYTWYESKYESESGIEVTTSEDFGTGKTNTEAMIGIWNADTDEAKNSNDVWGQIQTLASNGWFVPSIEEWDAFADAFDVDSSNYSDPYGLSYCYWSSSQFDARSAWYVDFDSGGVFDYSIYGDDSVRLSATF